jgi:hypothetical protein
VEAGSTAIWLAVKPLTVEVMKRPCYAARDHREAVRSRHETRN